MKLIKTIINAKFLKDIECPHCAHKGVEFREAVAKHPNTEPFLYRYFYCPNCKDEWCSPKMWEENIKNYNKENHI